MTAIGYSQSSLRGRQNRSSVNDIRRLGVSIAIGGHGAGVGDFDRVQLAVEVVGPEIEELLQARVVGRQVQALPDKAL